MKPTGSKGGLGLKAITFCALCVSINLVGSVIALMLRLPVYVDTIGTIIAGILLGPIYGMITGGLTSMVAGLLFDPTSLYFMPSALAVGLLTGLFFRKHKFEGLKSIFAIFIISLVCTVISSIIASFVFSGVTTSGSSYVVAALRSVGVNLFTSVFSTQFVSDLADKSISFLLAFFIISKLPKSYLETLTQKTPKHQR